MATQPPPQGAYPPPYAQQPHPGYPPRDPNAMVRIIAMVIIIVGYVSAGLGTLGSFFIFGVESGGVGLDGSEEFFRFLTSLSTALGIGAIAVAAGYLLRARASDASRP